MVIRFAPSGAKAGIKYKMWIMSDKKINIILLLFHNMCASSVHLHYKTVYLKILPVLFLAL